MLGPHEFACPYCSKIMKKKSDIQRHIRIHTGEKPYVCNLCEKRFTVSHHLQIHVRRYHPMDLR